MKAVGAAASNAVDSRGQEFRGALFQVEGAGCPACRPRSVAEIRWVALYAIENHSGLAMMWRLRDAWGFCDLPSRAVLALGPAPVPTGAPFIHLVRGLAADVEATGTRPLSTSVTDGEQPG
jgi:hypothetical protein